MKIGYVLGVFPKLSESFVLNEIVELIDRGHDVYIFSLFHPKEKIVHQDVVEYNLLDRTYYPPTKKELFVNLVNSIHAFRFKHNSIFNKFYCIALAKYFSKIVSRLDLDVIHAHFANEPAFTAMLISKLTGVPFTFTAHAFDIFISPDVKALRERITSSLATITISNYNKNYLSSLTGVSEDRIYVVRACPNTKFLDKIKRNEEQMRILTVARLVEKKGIKYGILAIKEIVKEFPEIEYRIVGSGPLEGELKSLVKSLNLQKNVKFLGGVNDWKLAEEYSRALVFLLPCIRASNGDMDGIPVSLMEAMYLGIPVISTTISGIPELVENEKEGFLVEPENVEQLANALKILLQDENMRRKMGKRGRRKIEEKFNIHKEVEKLLEIWRSLL